MATTEITLDTPASSISRFVIARTISRSQTFLRTMSTDPVLRTAMESVGYGMATHEEGWTLLAKSTGFGGPETPALVPARKAATEIEELASTVFERASAALQHKHPEQEKFVFSGLDVSGGPTAIPNMIVFLDRLDALQSSSERKTTRKADLAALETLTARGIDEHARDHARELLQIACTSQLYVVSANQKEVDRLEAVKALYLWMQDWARTARTVFKRKDQLIRLGLTKRKGQKKESEPVVVEPVVPVIPVAPATPPVGKADGDDVAPESRAA